MRLQYIIGVSKHYTPKQMFLTKSLRPFVSRTYILVCRLVDTYLTNICNNTICLLF